MSDHRKHAGTGEDGFILVAVIIVVTLIGLALTFFTEWVASAADRAIKLRDRVEAEKQITESLADVSFWLGIQPTSTRGIEIVAAGMQPIGSETASQTLGTQQPISAQQNAPGMSGPTGPRAAIYLRLDNTPYLAANGTIVQLQDARGLINVNFAEPDDMSRLLGYYRVPVEAQSGLIAKLLDYIDTDDLVRIGGAEKPQYAADGRPPPSNGLLRTPYELRAVYDWDKFETLWGSGGIGTVLSASRSVGINLNTAPAGVLGALGLGPNQIEAVLAFRRIRPFENVAEAASLMGTQTGVDPFKFLINPTNTFRVTIRDRGATLLREYSITLTPQGTKGPWRIDYAMAFPSSVDHADDAIADLKPFPEPATVLSKSR